MKTTFSPAELPASVIAVPPLCRGADGRVHPGANTQLIRHLEAGGVRTLLYGGNANFYNLAPSEFPAVLDLLEAAAGPDTAVVPSVGPYFGVMMDQAEALRTRRFPVAMVLPTLAVSTPAGVKEAVLRFTERAGVRAVLYLKDEGYVTPSVARDLVEAGVIAWIKYAVVRRDPAEDSLLRALVDVVDPALVVSGIGEQPVPAHWDGFGIRAFTSGCVCVAPARSQEMLRALHAGDRARAEVIRARFLPLETLRNAHGPIPVLHHAVAAAGLADTGPALPLLAPLAPSIAPAVAQAAQELRKWGE
jgi:dihydrodipicolinate synthase/N-acetylneuraminate lyase